MASGDIDGRRTGRTTRALRRTSPGCAALAPDVPDAVLCGRSRWTQLFGLVSFELFGHLHNVIHDYDAYFELQMRRAAALLRHGRLTD